MPKQRAFSNENSPSQDSGRTGLVLNFWNAGGLSTDKFTELKVILDKHDTDMFAIVEAGAATEAINTYKYRKYNLYVLPRGRQVASGIIVGVKKDITAKFKILHEMGENKFEAVQITIWKNSHTYKVIVIYNAPNNTPPIEIIESAIDRNTVIVGDFNAPSTRWGYPGTRGAGNCIEDFIDTNPVEIIDNPQPTFIAYRVET